MADADKPTTRGIASRVARLFRPYRGQVALVVVSILATAALGVAPSLLTKVVFDRALFPPSGHRNLHLLYELVAAMIAIPLVSAVISVGQTYLTTVIGQHVMQDLRNRLYEHLQAMSLRFFTATRTGELQSRLQNDVGGVQSVVTNTASSVLSNLVTVLSTVVAMVVLSWQLTLLSFAVVPVFVRKANALCAANEAATKRLGNPTSMAAIPAWVQKSVAIDAVTLRTLRTLEPPAGEAAAYAHFLSLLQAQDDLALKQLVPAAKRNDAAKVQAIVAAGSKLEQRAKKAASGLGLSVCAKTV